MFHVNDCCYSLRNPRILTSKHKSTTKDCFDTITFKGLQIWQGSPSDIKKLGITKPFQIQYKTGAESIFSPQNLSVIQSKSRICKLILSIVIFFLQNVNFVNFYQYIFTKTFNRQKMKRIRITIIRNCSRGT